MSEKREYSKHHTRGNEIEIVIEREREIISTQSWFCINPSPAVSTHRIARGEEHIHAQTGDREFGINNCFWYMTKMGLSKKRNTREEKKYLKFVAHLSTVYTYICRDGGLYFVFVNIDVEISSFDLNICIPIHCCRLRITHKNNVFFINFVFYILFLGKNILKHEYWLFKM